MCVRVCAPVIQQAHFAVGQIFNSEGLRSQQPSAAVGSSMARHLAVNCSWQFLKLLVLFASEAIESLVHVPGAGGQQAPRLQARALSPVISVVKDLAIWSNMLLCPAHTILRIFTEDTSKAR